MTASSAGEYVESLAAFQQLIDTGTAIKRAVMAAGGITHPFEEDLSFLYGTIFTGVPLSDGAHSRNVCIFADGEVDRSPTGTGVSGRAAIQHARGEIGLGQELVIETDGEAIWSNDVLGRTGTCAGHRWPSSVASGHASRSHRLRTFLELQTTRH